MIVENFGCLLIDNHRSKAYIQKLVGRSLYPEKAIYVDLKIKKKPGRKTSADSFDDAILKSFNNRKYFMYSNNENAVIPIGDKTPHEYASFDPATPVQETLEGAAIAYEQITAENLNDPAVVETVGSTDVEYFLFSGGAVLKNEILSQGKKFIHIHPGYLPDVKGSMAIEWSILLYGRPAATAFFMERKIDAGKIIRRKFYDLPVLEHNSVAPLFSSHIRSELLVEIIESFVDTGDFKSLPQEPKAGHFYYKMHPALHNIVFFECSKKFGGAF